MTTIIRSLNGASAVLVAAAYLTIGLVSACASPASTDRTMTISIKATMTAPTYVVGEHIQVRITIENHGQASIEVADPLLHELNPEYIITGPDAEQHTVTLGTARIKTPLTDPMSPPVEAMLELAAGGVWSEVIPLDPMIRLTTPGSYRLQVVFGVQGDRILTPEEPFEIKAPHITAFAALPTTSGSPDARLFAAWAHDGEPVKTLVEEIRLARRWTNDRAGKLYTSTLRTEGPVEIRQLAVPAMHEERGMDFASWLIWTEPGTIKVQRTNAGRFEGSVTSVHTSAADLLLVDSPVMNAAHNVRIFALERQENEATLVRLDVNRGDPASALITYRTALPITPIASKALHFHAADRDHTVLFFLGRSQDQILLAVVRDRPSPSADVIANLGTDLLVPGSPLAVYTTHDGQPVAAWATFPKDRTDVVSVHSTVLTDTTQTATTSRIDEIPVIDTTDIQWSTLAMSDDGPQLLWRDREDRLWHGSRETTPARIVAPFMVDPALHLLINGRQVFIVGVRADEGFGLKEISGNAN